jgi:hypothetical protein
MCELPITICHRKGGPLEDDIMKSPKQHGVSIDENSKQCEEKEANTVNGWLQVLVRIEKLC